MLVPLGKEDKENQPDIALFCYNGVFRSNKGQDNLNHAKAARESVNTQGLILSLGRGARNGDKSLFRKGSGDKHVGSLSHYAMVLFTSRHRFNISLLFDTHTSFIISNAPLRTFLQIQTGTSTARIQFFEEL